MNNFLIPAPVAPIGRIITSPAQAVIGQRYGVIQFGAAGHYWYKLVVASDVTPRTVRWVDPSLHRADPTTIIRADGSSWVRRLGPDDRPEMVQWNDSLARHASLVRASSDAVMRWYSMTSTPIRRGYILNDRAIELIRDLGPECVAFLSRYISEPDGMCANGDDTCSA